MKNETKLTSNVLQTFNDLSEDECEDKCINHRLCKSFNAKNTNGVNCEINSKSTEDPFDDVISTESTGWTYKTTDYQARNVSGILVELQESRKDLLSSSICTLSLLATKYICIENFLLACKVSYRNKKLLRIRNAIISRIKFC